MRRRNLLRRVTALAAVGLAGCSGDGEASPTSTPTASATPSPTETTVPDQETDTRSETQTTTGDGTPSPGDSPTATESTPTDDSPTPPTETPSPTPDQDTPTETPTATPTPTATETDTPTPPQADDVAQEVEVGPGGSLSFDPEEFTIETGQTVRWTWDSSGHNVRPSSTPSGSDWSGTEGGDSETYSKGHTYEFEFTTAGNYEYYCAPHKSVGMTASFTVE